MKILDWNLILRRDNFFLCLQFLFTGIIVFFSASGLHYPISIFLGINTILYLVVCNSSKSLACLFKKSWMFRIFLLLAFISMISYINVTDYSLPKIPFLKRADYYNLFFYSLVWFFNFIFTAVYTLRINSYKLIYYSVVIFFVCAIYSNIRAYMYNRTVLSTLIQYHYYYYVLVCLPFLFIKSAKLIRYLLLLIAFVATIYSFKRSGVFVCMIMFVFFLYADYKRSLKTFVGGILLLIPILFVFNKYVASAEATLRTMGRMETLAEDRGSGRGDNLITTLELIDKGSFEERLLGHGSMSMVICHYHMIDVEWVAIYYYYGLIGIILYVLFHFLLLKRLVCIKQTFKDNDKILYAYIACWTIFAFYSFTGEMFSYQYLSSLLFIFLGMMEGLIILQKGQNQLPIYRNNNTLLQ